MKKLLLVTIVGMFTITAFAQGPFGGFRGGRQQGFGGFGMGPMRGPNAPQVKIEKKEAPKAEVKKQKKEELKKPQLKKPQFKPQPQPPKKEGFGFGSFGRGIQMPPRQQGPQFGFGGPRGFGFGPGPQPQFRQPQMFGGRQGRFQPKFNKQGRFPQRRIGRQEQRGVRRPQQRRGRR